MFVTVIPAIPVITRNPVIAVSVLLSVRLILVSIVVAPVCMGAR
jgi:hypothetical protein